MRRNSPRPCRSRHKAAPCLPPYLRQLRLRRFCRECPVHPSRCRKASARRTPCLNASSADGRRENEIVCSCLPPAQVRRINASALPSQPASRCHSSHSCCARFSPVRSSQSCPFPPAPVAAARDTSRGKRRLNKEIPPAIRRPANSA